MLLIFSFRLWAPGLSEWLDVLHGGDGEKVGDCIQGELQEGHVRVGDVPAEVVPQQSQQIRR